MGDPLRAADSIRTRGCDGRIGVDSRLGADSRLDAAAARASRGAELGRAVSAAGYRAAKASLIHIQTSEGDSGIARILASQFCDLLTDADFRQAGIERRGDEVWIVLAAPLVLPGPGDVAAIAHRVLALVNEARAKTRRCGRGAFAAATALAYSPALEAAALAHARDMAARGVLGHKGGDGSLPAERATRAGYRWRAVAENVAAGATTPEQVVADWLASAGHCANLMDPQYTELGVGYAVGTGDPGIYWAQVFAAPAARRLD